MNDVQIFTDLVQTLQIRAPATAGRLSLIPLVAGTGTCTAELPGYLLYQQAQDMGLISIEETSESGTVGQLQVQNRAGQPVLLVEGEVLLGMKQTRVLNLTILVPAQARLTVPVSCVESGRWCATSEAATGKSDIHLAPSIRAAKTVTVARSMRTARSFASDQGAVWNGVDRVLESFDVESPSSSYADLAGEDSSRFLQVARTIEPEPGQVGVIACAAGRVTCVDVFESPIVLAAFWEGLVASYQAEAIVPAGKPAKPDKARSWFRSITAGSTNIGPELGLGAHLTVVAPNLEAAALVYDERVLHFSAFPAHHASPPARFASPARRRS